MQFLERKIKWQFLNEKWKQFLIQIKTNIFYLQYHAKYGWNGKIHLINKKFKINKKLEMNNFNNLRFKIIIFSNLFIFALKIKE